MSTRKYIQLIMMGVLFTSCTKTLINFDDELVFHGVWVGKYGEPSTEKTIRFDVVTGNPYCETPGSGVCDVYQINGKAEIDSQVFNVQGKGSLGYSNIAAVAGPGVALSLSKDSKLIVEISTDYRPVQENFYDLTIRSLDTSVIEKFFKIVRVKKQN